MSLNAFAADLRRSLFEDLEAGRAPSKGDYSSVLLKDARAKGKPQMGSTRYLPDRLIFEFIYPDPHGAATLLSVAVSPPERIVFMPVPAWVIEQIWQGEITGSHHFLSDAEKMIEALTQDLAPDNNARYFG